MSKICKKRVYGNEKIDLPCVFLECTRSPHFTLLMYLFIEKRLGGGISYIAKRQSKANDKYMKNYDPTKLSIYIPYLDMNNLYGSGMSDYFTYGRFKWLKGFDSFDVNLISEKSPIGYILEVGQEYPDELHVLHNCYPLAPKKPCDKLSDYCKKIADEYGIKSWWCDEINSKFR